MSKHSNVTVTDYVSKGEDANGQDISVIFEVISTEDSPDCPGDSEIGREQWFIEDEPVDLSEVAITIEQVEDMIDWRNAKPYNDPDGYFVRGDDP